MVRGTCPPRPAPNYAIFLLNVQSYAIYICGIEVSILSILEMDFETQFLPSLFDIYLFLIFETLLILKERPTGRICTLALFCICWWSKAHTQLWMTSLTDFMIYVIVSLLDQSYLPYTSVWHLEMVLVQTLKKWQ